jgi:putative chitinase
MKILSVINETTTPASVVAGPGETVYSIGRKYAVDPQSLFKLNNFNKDTRLEVGQKVILSAKSQQEKPNKSGIPAAVPVKNKPPRASVQLEPQGLGATIEQAAKANGIEGVHLACFMAQCKVETAGFKSLHEWATGDKYEGRKDLGNIYPGDGRKFKGRGFIHLTGRGDYTKCNEKYKWQNTPKDIVKNPTLVETDIDIATTTSLWYWDTYIRPNYKATSIVAVSTRVNGTNPNGLSARIDAFKNYCAKLGIKIKGIVAPIHKATKHHAELDPAMDPDATQVAANDDEDAIQTDLAEDQTEQFCPNCGGSLAEEGRASRALCTSGRPDSALGASQLASCKSQGLRARDGEKSHLITHGARKVRVTVGGKKIKGKKYGGPLPDYGTRKNQVEEDLEIPSSSTDPKELPNLKDIQTVMNNLGYTGIDVTKGHDPATIKVFKQFQIKHGLKQSGQPDAWTIEYLNKLVSSMPELARGTSFQSKIANTGKNKDISSTTPVKTDTPTKIPANTTATNQFIKPYSKNITKKTWPSNIVPWQDIEQYLSKFKMDTMHVRGILVNIGGETHFDSAAFRASDEVTDKQTGEKHQDHIASVGLFQHKGPRMDAMIDHCGGPMAWQKNWQGQIDFAMSESLTPGYLKTQFVNSHAAAWYWCNVWEKPADGPEEGMRRANYWLKKLFPKG